MNEPRRLHEAPETQLERSLLDAGRRYRASPPTRARVLTALGVAGTTAATTTAAASTKWALSLLALGGLVVPVALYLRLATAPLVSAPVASVAELARPALPSAPAPEPIEATAVSTSEAAGPVGAPARPGPKPAANVPLSAELAALDMARSALARGEAASALTKLDAYAKAFPSGKLRLEAEVLRITALARTGRTAAANERAQAFLRRHPDSLLAARVRAHLTP